MAELGQTSDPAELIPGDPAAIADTADELRTRAETMQDIATELSHVRIPGWQGPASNAFWDTFSAQPPRWARGSDAMTAAATILDDHSSSVTDSQRRAGEAIELWQQGMQQTRAAIAEFEAAGGTVRPTGEHDPYPAVPTGTTASGEPFTDPGQALREKAQAILDRARSQLQDAGDTHAAALDSHAGQRPDAPGWLAAPAEAVQKAPREGFYRQLNNPNSKLDETWLEKSQRHSNEENKRAYFSEDETFQKYATQPNAPETSVTLAGDKVLSSELYKVQAERVEHVGGATMIGQAEVKLGSTDVSWAAGINQDGLFAQGRAGVSLVEAAVKGSAHYGPVDAGGSLRASVGAEVTGHAQASLTGVHAGLGAFAGGRITAEAHADVGGVGVGVQAEAWAGIGAEADIAFGMNEQGEFEIGTSVGAALGVGGKLGYEITIDPAEVHNTLNESVEVLRQGMDTTSETLHHYTGEAVQAYTNTTDTVTDTVDHYTSEAHDMYGTAQDTVTSTVDKAADTVTDTYDDAKDKVSSTLNSWF